VTSRLAGSVESPPGAHLVHFNSLHREIQDARDFLGGMAVAPEIKNLLLAWGQRNADQGMQRKLSSRRASTPGRPEPIRDKGTKNSQYESSSKLGSHCRRTR